MAINVNGAGSTSVFTADSNVDGPAALDKIRKENPTLSLNDALLKLQSEVSQAQLELRPVPSGAMGIAETRMAQSTKAIAAATKHAVDPLEALQQGGSNPNAALTNPVYGLPAPAVGAANTVSVISLGTSVQANSTDLAVDINSCGLLLVKAAQQIGQSQNTDAADKAKLSYALKMNAADKNRQAGKDAEHLKITAAGLKIASGSVSIVAAGLAAYSPDNAKLSLSAGEGIAGVLGGVGDLQNAQAELKTSNGSADAAEMQALAQKTDADRETIKGQQNSAEQLAAQVLSTVTSVSEGLQRSLTDAVKSMA